MDESLTKFDEKEKANVLQRQIFSVFTKEPNDEGTVLDKKTEVNLFNINLIDEMFRRKLLKLNPNKSYEPDEMHP